MEPSRDYFWMKSVILIAFALGLGPHLAAARDPVKGKQLFETKGCIQCHSVDAGSKATAGPPLAGVTQIRDLSWLKKIIQNPSQLKDDPEFQKQKKKYPVPMPPSGLKDSEIEDVISYLETKKAK
jgi:mono/diheme cytochrome c family protein